MIPRSPEIKALVVVLEVVAQLPVCKDMSRMEASGLLRFLARTCILHLITNEPANYSNKGQRCILPMRTDVGQAHPHREREEIIPCETAVWHALAALPPLPSVC